MTIFKRLKNLWRLSEYRIDNTSKDLNLIKNVATIKKIPAKIIDPEPKDFFEEE